MIFFLQGGGGGCCCKILGLEGTIMSPKWGSCEKVILRNYFDFWHKVTVEYRLKIDLNDSPPKILDFRFLSQRGKEINLEWGFSSCIKLDKSKINAWNFSDFLQEVMGLKDLKIDSNDFFGKNFVLQFFGKKEALHRSKIGFSCSTKNQCI